MRTKRNHNAMCDGDVAGKHLRAVWGVWLVNVTFGGLDVSELEALAGEIVDLVHLRWEADYTLALCTEKLCGEGHLTYFSDVNAALRAHGMIHCPA